MKPKTAPLFIKETTPHAPAAIALALLISVSPARADDEIVVSATRSPMPALETGTSITVIDAKDIELRQDVFALDALRAAAAVNVAQNGAFGGQAALSIRGESSGRTLVLLDGVIVNDPAAPGGGFDFGLLDVADIDHIEVLRGPQSILYGSEAIGGVVSITTKRGEGAPAVNAFLEGGSLRTLRGGLGVAGASGRVDYRASAFGITTKGVSRADGGTEPDGLRSGTASADMGAQLADNFRVETSLRYQRSDTDIDGFPPPNFTLADTNEREESKSLLTSGRAILSLFDGRFESVASLDYNRIDRRDLDGATETFSSQGGRLAGEYLARVKASDWLSFVAGAKTERTHINSEGLDDSVTVNSVYALTILKLFPALTLTAGGRHDDHEAFGGHSTARVTGAYRIDDAGLNLRASWGQGFAAPTLFQLNFVCCGGTEPNRNLQPETSVGWDAGFDKDFGSLARLSATYFRQETTNLIDFNFATGAYFNVDKTLRKGVETSVVLQPLPNVDLNVAYAHIEAIDRLTGAPLLRVPKNAATASADWRANDKLTLGASLRYNGEEQDFGGVLARFVRADFRAAYAATRSLEIYARLENAFDRHYEEALGYGEPGRSLFGGVRVRL
ncbi:MAG: TonB-dependent receptor [Alphaproteobacteria bacterium]|nr:TonB-dependent receptor [Alphaproteobacteria bacterium]